MSQHDEFDRSLAQWFDAEARPAATVAVLDRALSVSRGRRPRPRLFAVLGSRWVGDSVGQTSGPVTLGRSRVTTSMALLLLLLVLVLATGAVLVGARLIQTPWTPELRKNGDVIVFQRREAGPGWDLAAQDPETGEIRRIVLTDGIVDCPDRRWPQCLTYVRSAEWSPDGRWVAFQVSHESIDGSTVGPCGGTVGLWVTDGLGVPRQLTTPCEGPAPGPDTPAEEDWAWSPAGDRLAYARVDGETDELFVIDPTNGARTSLGTTGGRVGNLAWSPDGTRIAYSDADSVLAIGADGGERSLLADALVDIIDLAWSPDGSRILIQNWYQDQGGYRIQVMNADGTDPHVLYQGQDIWDSVTWSPAGDRILYMLSVAPAEPVGPEVGFNSQVWTVSPDGSNVIEVFDSDGCNMRDPLDRGPLATMGFVGDSLPVWAPGGQEVAYNDCGTWVVANADGTGEPHALSGPRGRAGGPPLLHRSWEGGGLSALELALIGQVDR